MKRLTYKIKLNNDNKIEDIVFEDLKMSPDTMSISFYIDAIYDLHDGDKIGVKTPIFGDEYVDVDIKVENIIRQGYFVFNNEYPINTREIRIRTLNSEQPYLIKNERYIIYKDGLEYVENEDGYIIIDNIKYSGNTSILVREKAFVDNDIVKYENEDFSFKEYDEANDLLVVDDGRVFLTNFVKEYRELQKITIPIQNISLDVTSINSAERVISVVYKNNKYDIISDGNKYIVPIEENGETINYEIGDGLYDFNGINKTTVNEYLSNLTVTIGGNSYNIETSYEPKGEGSFIYLYKNDQYLLSKGQKIIVRSNVPISDNYPLQTNRDGKYYIIYNGQRLYEDNLPYYKIKYGNEVTRLFLNKVGEKYLPYIQVNNGTIVKFNLISNLMNLSTVTRNENYKNEITQNEYAVTKYKSVTIGNTAYPSNISEENGGGLGYYVTINDYVEYELDVIDVVENNWLICTPYIDEIDMADVMYDYEPTILVTSMIDGVELMKQSIVQEIKNNFQYLSFSVKNEMFVNTDEIKFGKRVNYISLPMFMECEVGVNLNQENIVQEKFSEVEATKAINPIIDMEREVYYPVVKNSNTSFTEVTDINFNIHFRTRDANRNIIPSGTWNIIDKYGHTSITDKTLQASDLLYFLNFTEDDVFYQKSKLSKSFLRISIFNSMDINNQVLLHSATVFLDEGKLYGKYIKYIDDNQYEKYDSTVRSYCNVETEPLKNGIRTYDNDKRLCCQLHVENMNKTTTSSEGFYFYMFKEYANNLHEDYVYMKLDFCHAGEGKTIPLMMYRQRTEGGDVADYAQYDFTDFETFKEGIPLSDLFEMRYIPLKVVFSEKLNKYVYYFPQSFLNNGTTMDFNLWELKIKDESL